jgi:hypothetical protein
MKATSSKVTAIGLAGATLAAAVLATACGGGTNETARAPQVRTTTTTAAVVGTTHTTAAKPPEPARLPRLTPAERAARRAEERAQLVVLKNQCDAETGNPYARTERAKMHETSEAEANVLDQACSSAALALASIIEKDEMEAADAKAAARAAEQAAAKDAGLLP